MANIPFSPSVTETDLSQPEIRSLVEEILHTQRSGVLASCFMDMPLCSQMAFAADEHLRKIILVTPRQSAKYDNMAANPNVSFLISTARNSPDDPEQAQALTATAFATELEGERRHAALHVFCRKHPELLEFAAAETTAVMELNVDSYSLVRHLQRVTRISFE